MCTVQLHGKHVFSEFDTALILFSFNILPPPFLFFIPSPLKVRKALACLLSAIDQQLNKAGVRYVISSGTLLGAVRSSRFIPWDDDLDFRIHDDDFEKFQTCVSIKKLLYFYLRLRCDQSSS